MSSFIRRLLYVGYWGLVVFAFAYSGYCYFYPKGFSSERSAAVSQARRQVEETTYTSSLSPPSEDASSKPQEARRDVAPFVASQPAKVSQSTIQERVLDGESLTVPQPQTTKLSNVDMKEGRRVETPMAPDGNLCTVIPSKSFPHSYYVFVASPVGETPKVFVTSATRPERTRHSVSMKSAVATEMKKASVKTHTNIPSNAQLWQLAFLLNEVRQKKKEVLKPTTISISKIRIGDRTPGTNPKGGDGSDESIFENEPHYIFTLRLAKEDGSYCTARLLRSLSWMRSVPTRERRVSDGRVIGEEDDEAEESQLTLESEETVFEKWLDLEDFGCVGWAEVVSVEDFTYRHGTGNLVTGTFEHTVDNVVNLCVEGQEEPIGCTPNHPFWSADREEFVEAGELLFGERVKLLNGETKRVVQRYPRPGPVKVYNLEVFGEHVYHVTNDGVLVHNYCVYVQIENVDHTSQGYIGRTKDFIRRYKEHKKKGRTIAKLPGFEDVSYEEMRYAEDQLIRKLKEAGLDNKMNGMSIKKSDALSKDLKKTVKENLLDALGLKNKYPNFDSVPPDKAKEALEKLIEKLRETLD